MILFFARSCCLRIAHCKYSIKKEEMLCHGFCLHFFFHFLHLRKKSLCQCPASSLFSLCLQFCPPKIQKHLRSLSQNGADLHFVSQHLHHLLHQCQTNPGGTLVQAAVVARIAPIQKSSEDPPDGFRSPYHGAPAAHSLARSGRCRPPLYIWKHWSEAVPAQRPAIFHLSAPHPTNHLQKTRYACVSEAD